MPLAIRSRRYFKPLTDGEGLRYPLTIGPLSWRLLGHQIQPVKGSDGMIHLAYALLFTNSWNRPATLKSIEVVDPAHDNAVTGANHVTTATNQDITGLLDALADPALFAPYFPLPAWSAWRAFGAALYGLGMSAAERAIYAAATGRQEPPTARARRRRRSGNGDERAQVGGCPVRQFQ